MDIMELENAINELITKAADANGFVYIVDKKENDFALRLSAPVSLRAFMPNDNERKESGVKVE
jgi:hypothetical protein